MEAQFSYDHNIDLTRCIHVMQRHHNILGKIRLEVQQNRIGPKIELSLLMLAMQNSSITLPPLRLPVPVQNIFDAHRFLRDLTQNPRKDCVMTRIEK